MKTRPRILVTAAAGKTGSAVVEMLLKEGWPVRAFVHRSDQRSERLARLGAEVIVGSAQDVDVLEKALHGIKRAYYVPIFAPHATQAAVAFAVAARANGLEAIVQMSQWLSSPRHPSILTRETWLIDQLFSGLPGIAHVILNPGMFADNFLRTIDMATLLGILPVFTGASRSAPVATEDLAACVVELLKDPEAFAGRILRPTGPRLLSGAEMAAAIGVAIDRDVRAVEMPFWMFLKVARLDRVHPHEAMNWREYVRDHRAGAFEMGESVTEVVQEVTGRPPESFEVTARRYAARPFARRSPQNLLRMLLRTMILPLVPPLDIETYARNLQVPSPAEPHLSANDARWQAGHLKEVLAEAAI